VRNFPLLARTTALGAWNSAPAKFKTEQKIKQTVSQYDFLFTFAAVKNFKIWLGFY
jgi:hypothetical protein